MKKNIEEVFEALLNRYIKAIEHNIKSRIKQAKDKEFVKNEIKSEIEFMLSWLKADKQKAKLTEIFTQWHKRGDEPKKILNHIRKVFGEDVTDVLPFKRIEENGTRTTLYISEEEKALKHFVLDDRKLMKLFVRHIAYIEIQKKIADLFDAPEKIETKTKPSYPFKWTTPAPAKDNKNEFVQLIYGLHRAGFINSGKGEITKIVEAAADVFDVKLGQNWQSNHSASIHKAKHNYQPLIFHKIREAYQQYADDMMEGKRKGK
jgi:hypothetical protein